MGNGSRSGIQNKTEKKVKCCVLCCSATLGGECGVCGREKTSGGVRVERPFLKGSSTPKLPYTAVSGSLIAPYLMARFGVISQKSGAIKAFTVLELVSAQGRCF